MSIKFLRITIIILLAVMADQVLAQQKLSDVVAEANLEWMAGRWIGTMGEDGPDVELEWRWSPGRYAVHAEYKVGEYLASGIIMYIASRNEVVEIGTDSMGASSKGLWSTAGNGATVSYMDTKADGETEQYEVIYKKVDSETMEATMYGIGAGGQRDAQPKGIIKLKRKPTKARKATIQSEDSDNKKKVTFDPNDQQIVITAMITAQEGQEDVAEQKLIGLVPYAYSCDGCLLFNLHKKDDGIFLLYEVWRDGDAAGAFSRSEYVQHLYATGSEWAMDQPEFDFWKMAK